MSRQYTCTEDQFFKDTAQHVMTVIRDDGVHRHLRFRKARLAGSEYWFDLITWPGSLCIDGDMGTYVFRRLDDMFEFFRTDREWLTRDGRKLGINPGYWAEKLQAMPEKGVKEFDEALFDSNIKERLTTWIKDHRDSTSAEDRRELWDAVMDDVIGADGDDRKQIAAYDFHHRVNSRHTFSFEDFWETNVKRYTFHFIWCCYAIAWGVKTYDEAKGGAT